MFGQRLVLCAEVLILVLVLPLEASRRKSQRRRDNLQYEDLQEDEPLTVNMCEIEDPDVIYCYCDTTELNKATDGNCWIFSDTSTQENSNIWAGFSSQTRITHLTLHLRPDGTLKSVPTVAFSLLPSIRRFEVQYATLDTVHPFSFGNSTSIEEISLSRNSIKKLDPMSFANLEKAEVINLSENHITEIARKIFSNLGKLNKLFLDRNNISSIHDKAFRELKNLKELELYSNQIETVVPDTFKGLVSLERLDLRENRIEIIGEGAFHDLRSLQFLNLKENSIKFIDPKGFTGLTKLKKLNLQDNKLTTLGMQVFEPTGDLFYLDLGSNILETLLEDTMRPIYQNLLREEMVISMKGNTFRCDTRLQWMFSWHNATRSRSVRRALEEVVCYLESGTLPPRLAAELGPEATPVYDMTTLGIGPRTELLKLLLEELPDPLIKTPATFTKVPDCDPEEEETPEPTKETDLRDKVPTLRPKRPRPKSKTKKPLIDSKALNDMAETAMDQGPQDDAAPSPGAKIEPEVQPAAPVQESRSFSDSGLNRGPEWNPIMGLFPVAFLFTLVCS